MTDKPTRFCVWYEDYDGEMINFHTANFNTMEEARAFTKDLPMPWAIAERTNIRDPFEGDPILGGHHWTHEVELRG